MTMGGSLATLALAVTAALLSPTIAGAHERSVSYSTIMPGPAGAQVRVRLPDLELTRLPTLGGVYPAANDALFDYVTAHVRILAGDVVCAPASVVRLTAPAGWTVIEWEARCAHGAPSLIESTLFSEVAPSHLHFSRIRRAEGLFSERLLTAADPRWGLAPAAVEASARGGAASGFRDYVALGIEHISGGWDHLAFVTALLLIARTFRELLTLVTAFTLAHSVTLALALLGVVRPVSADVEALIGFSIFLVAAENAALLAGRDRAIAMATVGSLLALASARAIVPGALSVVALLGLALFTGCHFALLGTARNVSVVRAGVVLVFGLVHGFGFAGALLDGGLPSGHLLAALFGFNLGVEIGQVVVVLALFVALRLASRLRDGRWTEAIAEAGTAAVAGLGFFWLVTRTFH